MAGVLKRIGRGLLGPLIASAALSMAGTVSFERAAPSRLPIMAGMARARSSNSPPTYFVAAIFYALVVVISVTMMIVLIDKEIGVPLFQKYPPRIRRILTLLAAIGFIGPIVISITRKRKLSNRWCLFDSAARYRKV